jgi:hypothetical protein
MRLAATRILGEEIGEQLEDFWCVDAEGELRGAWKPAGRMSSFSLSIPSCFEKYTDVEIYLVLTDALN